MQTCHRARIAALVVTGFTVISIAPSAAAQGAARAGPFDPKSGRFATALPSEPARAPDTLSATSDKVWAALGQVYAELGVPLSVVDSSSHVIGAVRVTQRRPVGGDRLSRLLECGSGAYGPNAERYTVQLTLLTAIQPLGDKATIVDTRAGGQASPNGLSSTVGCASSGVLEEKIAGMLRKALGL
ncbi:MAG: hypothetical protein V4550_09600 [Gemmatimonadota bacterium]